MLRVVTCLTTQHDLRLVALAAVVCLATAFACFRSYSHAIELREPMRTRWLLLTGLCTASGIWATHFIAVLAFDLRLAVTYDLNLTIASLLLAGAATTAGFMVASSGGSQRALLGGGLLGAGIAIMHFVGMAALVMPAKIEWSAPEVVASILIGVGFAAAALYAFHSNVGRWPGTLAAGLLALAICGLHFTAMSAEQVIPDPTVHVAAGSIDNTVLAVAVASLSLLVITAGFATAIIDERRRAQELKVRMASIVETSRECIMSFDREGEIVTWNSAGEQLLGYPADEIANLKLAQLTPPHLAEAHGAMLRNLGLGHVVGCETQVRRRDGTSIDVWLSLAPMHAEDGHILGNSAIIQDISERKKAERAIRESEERLQIALRAAGQGIWELDCIGKTHKWDATARALCRIAPDEQVTDTLILSKIHPDDRERFALSLREAISNASGAPYHEEVRLTQRDGEPVRWIAIDGKIMFAADRPAFLIGTVRDISRRRNQVEHMQVVMRELSHRAKNLLAVIAAMARSSVERCTTLDEFEESFCSRINSLSHCHDLLTQNDWSGADLWDLVRRQLAPFVDIGKSRLQTSGHRVLLKPEAAQIIGLALHELATNATKYGSLSVPEGRLAISWENERLSQDEGQGLRLTWRETGGPAVQKPNREGFGSMVTIDFVARTLATNVEVTYDKAGLIWTLHIPGSFLGTSSDGTEEIATQSARVNAAA